MSAISESQVKDRTLIHVVACRRPDHFELRLRSEIFEEYFRALAAANRPAGTNPEMISVGGQMYYQPRELPSVDGCTLGELETNNLFRNGRTNVSHLRAVGIEKGVTIRIPTVMSNSQLSEFTNRYQQAATQLYAEFIQLAEASLEVIVRETVLPEPAVTIA